MNACDRVMYLLCKSEGVGDASIGEFCIAMSIHFGYNDVLRGSSKHARSKFTRMLNLEAQGTEPIPGERYSLVLTKK